MSPHAGSVGGAASVPASATSASKLQANALNACALSLLTQSPFCLLLQKPEDFSTDFSLVKISLPEDLRKTEQEELQCYPCLI